MKKIKIEAREASLKRKIRGHLRELGFVRSPDGLLVPPQESKDAYRLLHRGQRIEKFEANREFFEKNVRFLLDYFANGGEVDPSSIRPRLEVVGTNQLHRDLFRFASLYWKIPVSNGYGRRLRFLVWDDSIGKLIGIFALGDAVFNLRVRDLEIDWDHHDRSERLVNLMDAYVLGAVPPYNALLCGKMLACLIRTKEVAEVFKDKYGKSTGLISGEKKRARLVAVTTSSALGRSSIYNRLKLDGVSYFKSIGFTQGWGHFHIPDNIFTEIRSYLEYKGHKYAGDFEFGAGPNWRLRAIKQAMNVLGLGDALMKHGLKREVFISYLADNAIAVLKGDKKRANFENLKSFDEVANLCLERWVIPRAVRMPDFKLIKNDLIVGQINLDFSSVVKSVAS